MTLPYLNLQVPRKHRLESALTSLARTYDLQILSIVDLTVVLITTDIRPLAALRLLCYYLPSCTASQITMTGSSVTVDKFACPVNDQRRKGFTENEYKNHILR